MNLLILVFILLPLSGYAQGEQNSLIQLRSRTFDLHTDVERIVRRDHFIPLTDVQWIDDWRRQHPELRATVIHLDTTQSGEGRYVWQPDYADERYLHREGFSDELYLEGYETMWRSDRVPENRGSILLIPKDAPDDYYVGCSYDRSDDVPRFCSITVSYPPDRDIRIRIRMYRVTNPLNDFGAVAYKVRALVYCLDVTDAIESEQWEQGSYIGSEDPLPEVQGCRDLTS